MPRANALDHALIRKLFEGGMTRAEIARQVSCSKSSVARIIGKQAGSGNYGGVLGTVRVLVDPLDLFEGGVFRELDLKFGLAQGVFADGTKFQLGRNGNERLAVVRDGVLVCESAGEYLRLSPSGGAGNWRELNDSS